MNRVAKATLLVIDHDPGTRVLFQTALETEGYRVLIAENGQHSLNLLSHCTVDVILTDILMPGNDGVDLIPRLCAAQPGCKIIAMSEGAGARRSLTRAKAAGADHTITKPCSVQTLLDAITAQLRIAALK